MQLLEISRLALCLVLFVGAPICLANGACDNLESIDKCVAAYHESSEAALNNQYKKAMLTLSRPFKEELKVAEVLWIKYRQDTCGSLNSLDAVSCEGALADQRTQELYFIERRAGLGVGRGVVGFISEEYGEKNSSEILAKITKKQPQSPAWSLYSEKHCQMMSELIGEDHEHCKIRLVLNNWEGF